MTNLKEYFWHIIITLGLFVLILFGATALSLRFSNDITFTDTVEVTEPSITIVDPQLGSEHAKIVVVTYSDFACGSCATVESILLDFMEKHPDDLRVVWKDMPNETRHSEAVRSAIAARCAAKQGKFWEYNAALFANQSMLGNELYQTIAADVGIDTPSFSACLESEDTRPLVERTLAEGLALEISATPTLFVNGDRFTGSLSRSEIESVLSAALAR
jgi:protein-disulfide isomerase